MPVVDALLATNRPEFFQNAYDQYFRQDYGPLFLSINDGEGTHGAKMDALIRKARHDFFVIWDDDDFYSRDRVSKLMQPMIDDPEILCVGTSLVYYVDERSNRAWLYDNVKVMGGWRSNDSLFWLAAPCYRRVAYEKHGPWEDLKCGADLRFLHKLPRSRVVDLRDSKLMVCRIHDRNAAAKEPHPPGFREVSMDEVPRL